ncbi:unnamed protein product [Neospora caninum Liverpool]|uniref:AP2 domain transcription factor AP2VI-2 n=1 Tax=Neospora caninum (strain Liverpool) TaxID=572307 RepID=F0VDX0_NEOCL|nr:uncharacterized protein NCLIV_017050 [Neospora caninum Liverpool]CBZ51913.1 unnamed protein product [Neospora caninum Liverpool]CEL65875.1 TPA: AP2 domain transcription factor AP2VI-2 [Neospora caninum Liverpool]|eukprot:XP_003881946.1 uncharacterized protein NCLIV_017050 [Neospora caninum Liverpool]
MQQTARACAVASRLTRMATREDTGTRESSRVDLAGGGAEGRQADTRCPLEATVFGTDSRSSEASPPELPCLLTGGRPRELNAGADEPKKLAQPVGLARRGRLDPVRCYPETGRPRCSGNGTNEKERLGPSVCEERTGVRQETSCEESQRSGKLLDRNHGQCAASSDQKGGHWPTPRFAEVYVHPKAPRADPKTPGATGENKRGREARRESSLPVSLASSTEQEAGAAASEKTEGKAEGSPSAALRDSFAAGDGRRPFPVSVRATRDPGQESGHQGREDTHRKRSGELSGLRSGGREGVRASPASPSCCAVGEPLGLFFSGCAIPDKQPETPSPSSSVSSTFSLQKPAKESDERTGRDVVSAEQAEQWSAEARQFPPLKGVSYSSTRHEWICDWPVDAGAEDAKKRKKIVSFSVAKYGVSEARRLALEYHIHRSSEENEDEAQDSSPNEDDEAEDKRVAKNASGEKEGKRSSVATPEDREERGHGGENGKTEAKQADDGRQPNGRVVSPALCTAADQPDDNRMAFPYADDKGAQDENSGGRLTSPSASPFSHPSSPCPSLSSPAVCSPSLSSPSSGCSSSPPGEKTGGCRGGTARGVPLLSASVVSEEDGIEWDAAQRKWIFRFLREGQPAKKTFSVDKYGFSTARRLALMAKQMNEKAESERKPASSPRPPVSSASSSVPSPLSFASSVCGRAEPVSWTSDSTCSLLSVETRAEDADGGKSSLSSLRPSSGWVRPNDDGAASCEISGVQQESDDWDKGEADEPSGSAGSRPEGAQIAKRRRGRPPKKKKVVRPRQPRLAARPRQQLSPGTEQQAACGLRRSLRVESRAAAMSERGETKRPERQPQEETLEIGEDGNDLGLSVDARKSAAEGRPGGVRHGAEGSERSPSNGSQKPRVGGVEATEAGEPALPTSLPNSKTARPQRDQPASHLASSPVLASRASLRTGISSSSLALGDFPGPSAGVSLLASELRTSSSCSPASCGVAGGRVSAAKSSVVVRGDCPAFDKSPSAKHPEEDEDGLGWGPNVTTEERIRRLRLCLEELKRQQEVYLLQRGCAFKQAKHASEACVSSLGRAKHARLRSPYPCEPCEGLPVSAGLRRHPDAHRAPEEVEPEGERRRGARRVDADRDGERDDRKRDREETGGLEEGDPVSVATLQVIAAVLSDFLQLCGSPSRMECLGFGERQIQFCQQSIPLLQDSLLFLRSVQSTDEPSTVAFASLFREILLLLPRSASSSPMEIFHHLTKLVRGLLVWRRAVTGERRADRGDKTRVRAETPEQLGRAHQRERAAAALPSAGAAAVLRALQLQHGHGAGRPGWPEARRENSRLDDRASSFDASPSSGLQTLQRRRDREVGIVGRLVASPDAVKEEASDGKADQAGHEARLRAALRTFLASKKMPCPGRSAHRQATCGRLDSEASMEPQSAIDEARQWSEAGAVAHFRRAETRLTPEARDTNRDAEERESASSVRGRAERKDAARDREERTATPTAASKSRGFAAWQETMIRALQSATTVEDLRGSEALQRLFALWKTRDVKAPDFLVSS